MAAKRKSIARKETIYLDTDEGKVPIGSRFKFTGGVVREYLLRDYPDFIRVELMAHGQGPKIGDHYNTASSVADAIAKADEMHQRLMDGAFHIKGAGGSGIADNWIQVAIAEQKNLTVEATIEIWNTLPIEAREACRKDAATKALAEKLRAEAKLLTATPATADPLAAFGPTEAVNESLDELVEELIIERESRADREAREMAEIQAEIDAEDSEPDRGPYEETGTPDD